MSIGIAVNRRQMIEKSLWDDFDAQCEYLREMIERKEPQEVIDLAVENTAEIVKKLRKFCPEVIDHGMA